MKNRITLITLFTVINMWFAPCISAQNTTQQRKDSLRQVISKTEGKEKLVAYNQLANCYMAEILQEHVIDTIFAIYDQLDIEAKRIDNISYQGIVRYNKLSAFFNKKLYDEVIREAPASLSFMEKHNQWKSYYQTYELLANAHIRKREFEQALHEAQTVYEYAKGKKDAGGMGLAMLTMSRIYNGQRRFSDEEKSLKECIGLLQDSTGYLNTLTNAYYRLGNNLVAQRRYDEVLPVALKYEEVNRRYEEQSKSVQHTAWINLWLLYADLYRQSGEYDKAEIYVNKIDSISNGSIKLYEERAQIFYGKKQYAEALEMIEKAIEVTTNKLQPKGLELMILIEMGEAKKAYELFNEIIVGLDSRHNTAFNARLDELRTQYEVDKLILEKERNRNYFLFACGGCLLLLLLLGVFFYYNRLITKKNRSLYEQIKGQNRLGEELDQIKYGYETLDLSVSQTEKISSAIMTIPGDRKQRELVARLREYMLRDGNISDTNMNRDEFTSILSTNRITLSNAVKAVTGKTFMEYVRVMQLEEACRMLDNDFDLTIEGVAHDCGFNTISTFYRLFRKHYGISPSEYRKMAVSFKYKKSI